MIVHSVASLSHEGPTHGLGISHDEFPHLSCLFFGQSLVIIPSTVLSCIALVSLLQKIPKTTC